LQAALRRAGQLWLLLAAGLLFAGVAAAAQDTPPGQSPALDRTLATLHGVVGNAQTGEPLARALVRVEGDANTGALTDGEGRFEIPGLPVGPQAVTVVKPGFRDQGTDPATGQAAGPAHNVLVAAEMPDVIFALTPTAVIRGQIVLSTGEPAEEIALSLVRRSVEDGRGVWMAAGSVKTRSDGSFRFGGLAPGDYALFTEPALESDAAATLAEPASGSQADRRGYPGVFYPDAADFSGAAKIHLAPGDEAQANLTLNLEPFHAVAAAVTLPGGGRYGDGNPAGAGMSLSAVVMDAEGRILPYTASYDAQTHTVQALLPDGGYALLVTVTISRFTASVAGNPHATAAMDAGPYAGAVIFAVAGHAVTNLRVPLSVTRGGPVETTVERSGQAGAAAQRASAMVMLSQAGGEHGRSIDDGMVSAFAEGPVPGPLKSFYTMPGAYWVHTHVAGGLCEASFTAGGASLAREPVMMGLAGSLVPMQLALRDDCAQLKLSLPQNLIAFPAGEEPYYTVYVVPDFDFTGDIAPVTLRASTGGAATLSALTPGSYHVYTAAGFMHLEYRNPAVLAAFAGRVQAVTLSPGAASELAVEAPGQ
jgi:hypothetical protein